MEKYFIIKKESLVQHYADFLIMKQNFGKAFNLFLNEFKLETTQLYPYTKKLKIVPTTKDLKKLKFEMYSDKQTFKEKSKYSKRWKEICMECNVVEVEDPMFELASLFKEYIGGAFSTNMFRVNNILYGSFKYDVLFTVDSEYLEEIKKEDFEKIIKENLLK